MVVLGHCDPPLLKYIYGFHMPLFLLLTGAVYKQQPSFIVAINKYAKNYVLPYFIMSFMNLFIVFIKLLVTESNNMGSINRYIFGIFYSRGSKYWMPNCSPLWYLTAIFVALLLYDIINRATKNDKCRWIIIAALAVTSYLLYYFKVPKLPWNIDTALMMIPFIEIGKQGDIIRKSIVLGIIALCIGIIAIYYNPVIVNFDNNEYGNIVLMLIGAIFTNYFIIVSIQRISIKYSFTLCQYWGSHTLYIMGFDYFIGSLLRIFLSKVNLDNWLFLFLLKMLLLTIGAFIWTSIINKIRNEKIRQTLSF